MPCLPVVMPSGCALKRGLDHSIRGKIVGIFDREKPHQPLPRTVHATFERAHWHSADLCRFFVGHAVRCNQDQSFPVLDRELRERFEHVGKVTPSMLLRWCPQPSGVVPVQVLKLASGFPVLAVETRYAGS